MADEHYFDYKDIPISSNWTGNLKDFLSWIEERKNELSPPGAVAQSISSGDGTVAFENEYPTFEKAYEDYKKQFEN